MEFISAFFSFLLNILFMGYQYLFLILLVLLTIKKWRARIWEIIDLMNLSFAVINPIYLLTLVYSLLSSAFSADDYEMYSIYNRAFGQFWWAYWMNLLPHFLGMLFFFKKFRGVVFLPLLIILFLNIERFVIIITSTFRDYLPSSWTYYYSMPTILLSLFFYCLLLGFIYFLKTKFSGPAQANLEGESQAD